MESAMIRGRVRVRHHGQAMVEFLVCALFVLVPLFFAITAIGKLSDVQRTADMAARYATWERTVWYPEDGGDFDVINEPNQKSAQQIRNEIGMRLISDRSGTASIIVSTDKDATDFGNGTDTLWKDHAGTRFLDSYDQMTSSIARSAPDADVAGGIVDTLAAVGVNGLAEFVPPLPTETLATAEFTLADIGANSQAYQRLWSGVGTGWAGLNFSSAGAILSNTWAANGGGSTKAMVRRTVPTAGAAGAFINTAKLGLRPWDPVQDSRIEVGKIDVDVVPEDRLR